MSAVFCLFQLDGRPVDPADLGNMAAALSEYGPDGYRCWPATMETNEPAGLGNLLQCITAEDTFERQPLVSGDGQWVLVADARLDNRAELCVALNVALEQSLPDSALILKAFEKWSEACPCHLLGDFVFIVWNRRTRKLFCARDPIGQRVLFYYQSSRLLALASAPKGLFALSSVPRRLNRVKLADFLALIGDTASSFYEAIYRLPAAHTLTATGGGVQIRSYWSMDPERQLTLGSEDEYLEAFREIFTEAVRCRLRSISPVGAFLSGGLDSSAVAGVAASQLKQQSRRLKAFTAIPQRGFMGPERRRWYNDETPYVEAIRVMQDNLDVDYVPAEGRMLLDQLDRLYSAREGPVRNPCNRVWTEAILEQAQSQGIQVLLSGQGGNATMSYHGISRLPELALHGHWLTAWQELHARGVIRQEPLWPLFKRFLLKPLLPEAFHTYYRRWRGDSKPPWHAYSAIHPAFAEEVGLAERFRRLNVNAGDHLLRNGRVFRIRWLTEGASYDAYDLASTWRASFGVEVRDPTLDKRVVEFCLAIPQDQYLRHGWDRLLIRRAMTGILPPEVLWKTERGAQTADWYERLTAGRERLLAQLDELARFETVRHCLDLPRMRYLVEHWPQGNGSETQVIIAYRFLLLRGMMVGGFIRWFEEQQRR